MTRSRAKSLLAFIIFCAFCLSWSSIKADDVGKAAGTLDSSCNCQVPWQVGVPNQAAFGALNDSAVLSQAWLCTKNFFGGVWDGSGGMIVDAATCAIHPVNCAHKSIDAVKNTYSFLWRLITDTKSTFREMHSLTSQDLVKLVCSVVGTLAADVAIAVLTAGAASGKLGATMAKIMLKIEKIAKYIEDLKMIPIEKLGVLSGKALDKAKELADLGYGKYVKDAVMVCE